ncbi:MAG: FAD-dependent oxidoreductase, partial [Mesorhizobium sp.]
NVGRNTTAVRSNYLLPANTRSYEHSMKLWENLSHDLNYNVMFSQRGQLVTAHSADQLDGFSHRANVMRLNGIDADILDRDDVRRLVP